MSNGTNEPVTTPSLGLEDTAAFLGVAVPVVRRLIRTKALAAFRVGKRLRVWLPDLEDYLRRARTI